MISIVTISFNQGQYLPTAVESVLLQEGVDLEYVIVDPGSTDGSRDYLCSLRDPRVRLVLEEDEGPADGLNKGCRLARGEVLGYLNADDIYVAGALAEAHELLAHEPEVDVVYGDGWLIDGGGRVLRHYESTRWNTAQYALGGVNVLQQATFLKKSAFERAGGFNKTNRTCWDAELLIDMGMVGANIIHRRRDWGMFRLHEGGISGSGRLAEVYKLDRERLRRKALGERFLPIGAPARNLAIQGWKLATNPGHSVRRLREVAPGRAQIVRERGGFVVRAPRDSIRASGASRGSRREAGNAD